MSPRTTKSLSDLLGDDVPQEGADVGAGDNLEQQGIAEALPTGAAGSIEAKDDTAAGGEATISDAEPRSPRSSRSRGTRPSFADGADEPATATSETVLVGPNAEWIHLEVKTARFYPGQFAWLTEKRKELNRLRAARGKRITENTLLRIAIDLFIKEHADDLQGFTENELRASVGLDPVKSLAAGE